VLHLEALAAKVL